MMQKTDTERERLIAIYLDRYKSFDADQMTVPLHLMLVFENTLDGES